MKMYYREKIIKLHDKLFKSRLSAKDKIVVFKNDIEVVYMARENQTQEIWKEFKNQLDNPSNEIIENFLEFLLGEYYRVL